MRGKSSNAQAKGSNRTKSIVRVRVEHVSGAQNSDMGGTLVRAIGLARAKVKMGIRTSPTTCAASDNSVVSTLTRRSNR
jgi:hypothetical protein